MSTARPMTVLMLCGLVSMSASPRQGPGRKSGALLVGLPAPQARAQDAAAHRAWMDDAADLQDELREQLLARAGDKAADAAAKIEEILAQTQAYWAAKHAHDIVKIARESRTLATAVATAAKAGKMDQATEALAKLNAHCSACHDLHPEKR